MLDNASVLGVLLYGTVVKGESTDRSDWFLSRVKDERYDVRLFELMPLYLKIEVKLIF